MKIVSLNEKFCPVRILFTKCDTSLHVTHYRCFKLFIVKLEPLRGTYRRPVGHFIALIKLTSRTPSPSSVEANTYSELTHAEEKQQNA